MLNRLAPFTLLLSALLLSSCASLFAEDEAPLQITSNPPGALILVNGQDHGQTPQTLLLSTHRHHLIELRHDGYQHAHTVVNSQINLQWLLLDIPLLLVALPIDWATNNWDELELDSLHFNLGPGNAPTDPLTALR